MAKIRSIKPEFWVSEQIMECSPMARLLFIGLWNFCDDGGNHVAKALTIKAEVFPGDSFTNKDVQQWIDELVDKELLAVYEVDGKKYWHVTGWHHQNITRPYFKHPKYPENKEEKGHKTHDEQQQSTDETVLEQCSNSVQTVPEQCSSSDGYINIYGKGNINGNGNINIYSAEPLASELVEKQKPTKAAEISKVFRENGISTNPGDPRIIALANKGVPLETIRAVIAYGKEKKPNARLDIAYFLKVLDGWNEQAGKIKANSKTRPPTSKNSVLEGLARFEDSKRIVNGEIREIGQ